MLIQENISLKKYNTFGIDAYAAYFSTFRTLDELNELLEYKKLPTSKLQLPTLILGGGSNILFTQNFNGIVLKNELKGIEKVKEDNEFVYVKAGAGVNWHQFVVFCIDNNWAGVENLSLIPGNVGASPMQNIGAYGVEIKDVFYELEAFHLAEKKIVRFGLNECAFGYRESVFKRKHRGEFVIINVTYKLRKDPIYNTSYGAIEQELEKMGVKALSIKAISDAVINIRSSKLPNPAEIGNAGSFFKNPEILSDQFTILNAQYPNIVGYKLDNGNVKLAAGWLIEQCGWKGFRKGDAGCHAKQALVLVNYGNATGKEIYSLSGEIIASVKEKFGVELEREVNII
ncbi:UDP-N-acetylmuramate dehydrogenase [Ferruginibacter lapsinanis]|uniref:UDP-N-acetylmuramate dehydrogenase n=1 Tax=Ferruginibacter lapsinanis TaxID=563172 RepID=UPI001E3CA63A|nr:UDP-N-acetylmuramate dehydrogenase [Ferruginibacter lapsinanis]UEG49876.1 UDP-N-acetylmuramate dehydrogenase [Ferruginibacter lapsinanis]